MNYHRHKERAVLARLVVEMMRVLLTAQTPRGSERMDNAVILAAVTFASIQGRPLRPKKLADYIGIPRTSLLRRLDELAEIGWISREPDGHIVVRPDRLNAAEIDVICDKLSTMIHRAHRELLDLEQNENETVQIGH